MTLQQKASSSPKNSLKIAAVQKELAKLYPDAKCELDHKNVFELLVATVLSAQTTDVRVNQVTKTLFTNWQDSKSLAQANHEAVQKVIHPLGMGAKRAAQIIALAQKLEIDYAGQVPDDQQLLEALPGVGRKTAHVVRGTWFGHSLLTVDTHVARLAKRLGWSSQKTPLAIEKDIITAPGGENINFTQLSHELILHGRRICNARKPNCNSCPLSPAADVTNSAKKAALCPQIGVAK